VFSKTRGAFFFYLFAQMTSPAAEAGWLAGSAAAVLVVAGYK